VRYAKLSEFARERRYGSSTVRAWLREGLPHIGAGRSARILVDAADRWITERAEAQQRNRALATAPVIVAEVIQ
jgi:hypothetical protein